MNTYADKRNESKSSAVAYQAVGSGFSDNRVGTLAQRRLQHMADNSPRVQQAAQLVRMADQCASRGHVSSPVIQRVVKIGGDTFRLGARGYGKSHLLDLIRHEAEANNVDLMYGWRKTITEHLEETGVSPREFTDITDLLDYLRAGRKKARTEKLKEQDDRIVRLNTGFGPDELQRGSVIGYESAKAMARVTGQIQEMDEYKRTVMALEAMTPGARSSTNDFSHTDNSLINLYALQNAGLHRLDYMAPGNVPIDTFGYSSRSDRTVDASTLTDRFSLGTVKIGGIGTYEQEMRSSGAPPQPNMNTLNSLEMLRLPGQSAMTATKRTLYEEGEFSKDQGMGFDHDHSSVEFKGAVSGSGLTKTQYEHMQRQQTLSNYAILMEACNVCGDRELGAAVSGRPLATPQETKDALENLIALIKNPATKQEDGMKAKMKLRRLLIRIIRGVTGVDVDSEDETNYPTSPYDPGNY